MLGQLSKKGHKSKKNNPCGWTTHVDSAILGVRRFICPFILLIPYEKEMCKPYSKTSEAIVQVFLQDYVTPRNWGTMEQYCPGIWWSMQFPHVAGAIDIKHVVIKAPGKSGTLYHNYIEQFSIVLLAIYDAK